MTSGADEILDERGVGVVWKRRGTIVCALCVSRVLCTSDAQWACASAGVALPASHDAVASGCCCFVLLGTALPARRRLGAKPS